MRTHLGISIPYATVPNRSRKNNRVLRVDELIERAQIGLQALMAERIDQFEAQLIPATVQPPPENGYASRRPPLHRIPLRHLLRSLSRRSRCPLLRLLPGVSRLLARAHPSHLS